MRKSIVFAIGLRYLRSKSWTYLPSIGVTMSSLSIALSVAILIIVTSVMNGFHEELLNKILGFNSHITLADRYDTLNEKDAKIDAKSLKSLTETESVTLTAIGQGMLFANKVSSGVMIKGISYDDLLLRNDIVKSISGEVDLFKKDEFSAVIGIDLANNLGIGTGDTANLVIPIIMPTMFGIIPRYKTIKIAGIMNTGAQQYDSMFLLMPISGVQKLYNMDGKISNIEIMLKDISSLRSVEQTIKNHDASKKYRIINWEMENRPLIGALKTEASVMRLILGSFMVLSIFSIFAIISMMIYNKEREIAILQSTGFTQAHIIAVFFISGISISILGIILGNIFGIIIAQNIETIRLYIENAMNIKILDSSVYLMSRFPSKIVKSDLYAINICCFVLSIIASILPARKAVKKSIADVLRYF